MAVLSDPISDFLTRLKNARLAGNEEFTAPCSNIKVEIARILQEEDVYKRQAYIHCLVTQLGDTRGEGAWRPEYHTRINGNLSPTHGLGPVAQYMNLARGEDPVSYTHLAAVQEPSSNSR